MAVDLDHLHPQVMRPRVDAFIASPEARAMGIGIISAFRPAIPLQAQLYQQSIHDHGAAEAGKWVAAPWHSNHGPIYDDAGNRVPYGEGMGGKWGGAVDLELPGTIAVKGKWPADKELAVHSLAATYGLYFPMIWEDWHAEPIIGWHPAAATNGDEVRRYEVVTVPAPDANGHQIVGLPAQYPFDKVASVEIKANDNGAPVQGDVQPFVFGSGCALSFFRQDGHPVPAGNVGVIISTVA